MSFSFWDLSFETYCEPFIVQATEEQPEIETMAMFLLLTNESPHHITNIDVVSRLIPSFWGSIPFYSGKATPEPSRDVWEKWDKTLPPAGPYVIEEDRKSLQNIPPDSEDIVVLTTDIDDNLIFRQRWLAPCEINVTLEDGRKYSFDYISAVARKYQIPDTHAFYEHALYPCDPTNTRVLNLDNILKKAPCPPRQSAANSRPCLITPKL